MEAAGVELSLAVLKTSKLFKINDAQNAEHAEVGISLHVYCTRDITSAPLVADQMLHVRCRVFPLLDATDK